MANTDDGGDRGEQPASPSGGGPLLVGLLVDVSGSMSKQMSRAGGDTRTRLEGLRDSLDDLVAQARGYDDESREDAGELFHLFAYGFGFGNLRTVLKRKAVPPVRNLFSAGEDADLVLDAEELLGNWGKYRNILLGLTEDMLGTTPMVEAFSRAERLFSSLRAGGRYGEQPVLLVISDGVPTDPPEEGPQLVRDAAGRLRAAGVVIISCFVASADETSHRTLYASPEPHWSPGARLMFDCASQLPADSVFRSHLVEHEWLVPAGARLFAQVNQPELLGEFMQLTLSPLREPAGGAADAPREAADGERVSAFVSYSRADQEYVRDERGSLLSYLRALEHEGVSFWWDGLIRAGDIWDEEIKRALDGADIALVLVSQAYLSSPYCRKEIESLTRARDARGLRIVPVILSACDWAGEEWLSSTQVLPPDGKNIEEHYSEPGPRKALYLQILRQVRENAKQVRAGRAQPRRR